MKTLKILAIAIVLLTGTAGAQTMGVSAGHDLDALWAQAQKVHDLTQEDAVVLLESRTVTVGDEGALATRVHRVVWINSGLAIRAYADLRVPWNSATSTLDVELLRTWRDGRWWPDATRISDTAVVETLPHALDHAADYTTMRETMLLHDGVELPCVMETAYTIAEQGSPTAGADDLFVVPQQDPVVQAEYVLRVPLGVDVRHASLNGAPEPVVAENGVRELAWTMDAVGALRRPATDQPEAYEPTVAWSTWESWDALLGAVRDAVAAAAALDEALVDSLVAVTAGKPEGLDRSLAAVGFLNASVRPVHYDARFWRLAPRPAVRTWETGYGHGLDRAVLATALLGAVPGGAEVGSVVLVRPGFGDVAPDLPRLADVTSLRVPLLLPGGPVDYDPDTGELVGATAGHGTVRLPAGGVRHDSALSLDLSLTPGEDVWEGTGVLMAAGDCSDWVNLQTGDGLWSAFVEETLSSVLKGAEVTWARPALAGGPALQARFGFTVAEPARDEDGRWRLVVGQPASGIVAHLPRDIQVADATRESPVRLPSGNLQSITLRLKTAGGEIVAAPPERTLENASGSFAVATAEHDGWLEVTRSLRLQPRDPAGDDDGPRVVVHAADAWPGLRALLLEETDPVNGTIVFAAPDEP